MEEEERRGEGAGKKGINATVGRSSDCSQPGRAGIKFTLHEQEGVGKGGGGRGNDVTYYEPEKEREMQNERAKEIKIGRYRTREGGRERDK